MRATVDARLKAMIPKRTTYLFSVLLLLAVFVTCSSAVTYEYDDLNRVVKAIYEDGSVLEYSYDEVGNRLHMETGVMDTRKSERPEGDVTAPLPP
jgi:YD repeat-containing protein